MDPNAGPRKRLTRIQPSTTLIEYGSPYPISSLVSPGEQARWQRAANTVAAEVQARLGLRQSPLEFGFGPNGPTIRFRDVSGTFTAAGVSTEVAPKTYRGSEANSGALTTLWQADLLTLLARAGGARFSWARSATTRRHRPSFRDHFAAVFANEVERSLQHEPIHEYANFEESSVMLRGRLHLPRQLRSLRHRPHLLEYDVSRLTVDNPFNILLRWGCRRLARGVQDASLRRRLVRLEGQIPGEQDASRPPYPLPRRTPPQYRHWDEALTIARLVAQASGPVVSDLATTTGVGLLVAMERVWESFIDRSLHEIKGELDGLVVETQPKRFYGAPDRATSAVHRLAVQPDNVLLRTGHAPAVIDAKYKRLHAPKHPSRAMPPDSDIQQLLVSMLARRSDRGLLIYPRHASSETRIEIPSACWTVHALGTPMTVAAVELDWRAMSAPGGLSQVDATLLAAIRWLWNQ